jgi:hypothetical protein
MDIVIDADASPSLESQSYIKGYFDFYQNLFHCLGYSENVCPIGDWLRQAHGLEGRWLVASPIHWQATHNDAMIIACDRDLMATDVDVRQLFERFNDYVAGYGMCAFWHDQQTWLIRCDEQPLIQSSAPRSLMHQSLYPHLQALDPSLFWQRFITETQMLMSGLTTTNTPINGVWIWGEGRLNALSHRPIWVNQPKLIERLRLLSESVHIQPHHQVDDALIFVTEDSLDWLEQCRPTFKNKTVNWYWNNQAYRTKPSSWLSRLVSFKKG